MKNNIQHVYRKSAGDKITQTYVQNTVSEQTRLFPKKNNNNNLNFKCDSDGKKINDGENTIRTVVCNINTRPNK